MLIQLLFCVLSSNDNCVALLYCSGFYHQIVNSLDKRGYEVELDAVLRSASTLIVKDLNTCIAIGGPDVLLQSQKSR